MKKFISIIVIIMVIVMSIDTTSYAKTQKLNKMQWWYADEIARVVTDNWETYGVLPSVAVAQAYVESSLGKRCAGNNLWGIASGDEHYDSLYDGILRYCEVINEDYYKGAPFMKDWNSQLDRILAGGYCDPVGDYKEDAEYGYAVHNFEKYDEILFDKLRKKEIAEKEEAKDRKEEAEYIQANTVPSDTFVVIREYVRDGVIYANKKAITGGAAMLYSEDGEYLGTFDVFEDNTLPNNAVIANLPSGKYIINAYENAVG